MIVAPPLLALGAPSTLFLQTAGRTAKTRWLAVLRSRPFAVLTHPVTAWTLYFGLMFGFFLTPLINTAMHDMALMDLFNVAFLLGGCLYWWPLVGADPIVHWKMGYGTRMFSVLIGAAPETFLGIAILSERNPIASMYTVASTHAGGALLWTSTEVTTVIAFVPLFFQWMRSEERIAARADARADAQAALNDRSAVAATAAGGGGSQQHDEPAAKEPESKREQERRRWGGGVDGAHRHGAVPIWLATRNLRTGRRLVVRSSGAPCHGGR